MADSMRFTTTKATQGFKYYVEAEDPDILILTETKVGTTTCILLLLDATHRDDRSTTSQLTQHLPIGSRTDTGRYPKRKHTVCYRQMFTELVHRAFQLAGTAILSKLKPLNIDKTLPGHPDPNYIKGRIVTLEFEDYYVIGTYVVNAGQGLKVCPFSSTKRPG